MSAAARIVKDGGLIILAAQCSEGVPTHSPHDELLKSASNSEELLRKISAPGFSFPEQWSAHIQTLVQSRALVHLFCELTPETVRRAHLEPCDDISGAVGAEIERIGAHRHEQQRGYWRRVGANRWWSQGDD